MDLGLEGKWALVCAASKGLDQLRGQKRTAAEVVKEIVLNRECASPVQGATKSDKQLLFDPVTRQHDVPTLIVSKCV